MVEGKGRPRRAEFHDMKRSEEWRASIIAALLLAAPLAVLAYLVAVGLECWLGGAR